MLNDSRASLIGSVPNGAEVAAAFGALDDQARIISVPFQGGRASLHDVLRCDEKRRDAPLHVIVHPEIPERQDVKKMLGRRASTIDLREGGSAEDVAELWREIFQAEIGAVLSAHAKNAVIVNDPYSNPDAGPRAPLHLKSLDAGLLWQSGFLPPEELAKLIDHAGAVRPDKDVRIHGSTFGACPTGTTLQLGAATLFGAYLPDENSPEAQIVIAAMGRTAALRDATRIRMGTLLDYSGMHELLVKHPEWAGIFRIFDQQTKVIPDQNGPLMRGIDLRR